MNWDYIFKVFNENVDVVNGNFEKAKKEFNKLRKANRHTNVFKLLTIIFMFGSCFVMKIQQDAISDLEEESIEDDNNIRKLKEEIKKLKESKE